MKHLHLALLLPLLLSVACAEPSLQADAGPFAKDAGNSPLSDGGSLSANDAGTTPNDDAGINPQDDAGTTPNGTQKITLIHYNDFHANLIAHRDLVRDDAQTEGFTIENRGGAARVLTILNAIRAENPNSITMNIGDSYHGGVEALYTDGQAIAEVIAAFEFDIGVPGNWDFAFGPNISWMRYKGEQDTPQMLSNQAADTTLAPFPNLAANVFVDASNTQALPSFIASRFSADLADQDGNNWLPPTQIIEKDGLKIGFIGLTSDFVPRMHPTLGLGLRFLQGLENYTALLEEHALALRAAGADAVVVMSELGIQKDLRLADAATENLIDIFFSAHTHELTLEAITSNSGALVVEAGNDGWVGQMDLEFTNGTLLQTNWTLHEVTEDIEINAEMDLLVTNARAAFIGNDVNIIIEGGFVPNPLAGRNLTRSIETVIGQSDNLLYRRDALESSFNNAFTDMLRAYTETDVAISPGFRYEIPLLPNGWDLGNGIVASGDVTLEDAYRYFPAPYTLGVGQSTPEHLEEILEDLLAKVFSPEIFDQEGGWVDGFSGISADIDLTQPTGSRVTSFSVDDNATNSISVAGCRRLGDDTSTLCSFTGYTDVQDVIFEDTGLPMTPIELLEWGLNQAEQPALRNNLLETESNARWPTTPYVQPLRGVSP